jgi:hypothetical protein
MDKRQRRAIEDQAFASLRSKLSTAQSLELAQLVKDVVDAKGGLIRLKLERRLVWEDHYALFKAIDKLEAFYKVP